MHFRVPRARGQPQQEIESEFGVVRLEALFTLKPWRGGEGENNNEFCGAGERKDAAVAFAKVVWGKRGTKDKNLTEFVRYGFEPPDTKRKEEQQRRSTSIASFALTSWGTRHTLAIYLCMAVTQTRSWRITTIFFPSSEGAPLAGPARLRQVPSYLGKS